MNDDKPLNGFFFCISTILLPIILSDPDVVYVSASGLPQLRTPLRLAQIAQKPILDAAGFLFSHLLL